jgi:thioesterase domain-containing protein
VDIAGLAGRRTVRSILVPLTTTGTATPFFLIAGAGGLAVTFLPLARLLGTGQPVFGLQSRGIEQRAVPDLTFRQITSRYTKVIRQVQPHGPYLIGGHSLGGIHALQVAQHLRAAGEEVALLAIFDAHLTRAMVGRRRLASEAPDARRALHGAPRGMPRLSTVLRLPLVGIVPLQGTAQFDVFAALGEMQAALARRQETWDGRTVVFLSDDDEAGFIESRWSRLLTGPWRSAKVPGGHIAMLEQSNISVAAAVLREEFRAIEPLTH